MRLRFLSPLLLVLAVHGPALAQSTTSSIRGKWSDMKPGTPAVEARLLDAATGSIVARASVASNGEFTFHDVPFGNYQVLLTSNDKVFASRTVELVSNVPTRITLAGDPSKAAGILVTSSQFNADRTRTTSSTTFTRSQIEALPVISPEKKIESILLHTPSVVPDEDGRLHVRGEDAQLQYIIDGIPVTANMTRVYGSLFDAARARSVEVQTGGFDPEYGVAAAGIVKVNTRSGFDAPFFADATGSIGSFGAWSGSAAVGGTVGDRVGLSFVGGASSSDRYLDPVSGFEPNHDHGEAYHLFGRADVLLGEGIDLNLLGMVDHTEFEVPNRFVRTPAQDQQQTLEGTTLGGRLTFELGEQSLLSVLGYSRSNQVDFTSGGLDRISSGTDSLKALSENERFFIGAHRRNNALGGQIEFSTQTDWFNASNAFKVGVGAESYPLDEFFTFAITDSALTNPDTAGGEPGLQAFDIRRGGRPFLVDTSHTGMRISGYVQDKIVTGDWTISAGVRFDKFDVPSDETAISPRLAAAWNAAEDLTLRASYGRIVMQAPLENVLVASSPQAQQLTLGEQGTVPTTVQSEKAHSFEIGALWKATNIVTVDVVGYGKMVEDFIVKAELGNSGIIFPLNLKEGLIAGGELTATLSEWNGLRARLAVSGGVALGMKPEDGSSPIAAGLIIGEEGHNYSNPFGGEDVFPTEHSQMLAASLNASYRIIDGLDVILDTRFDSGLPFDLADENGNGLDAAAARAELIRRGYSEDVIDMLELESEIEGNAGPSPDKSVAPHATVDLALRAHGIPLFNLPVDIGVGVINAFDTPYLYKFESSFGGTHFGVPRSLFAEVSVHL